MIRLTPLRFVLFILIVLISIYALFSKIGLAPGWPKAFSVRFQESVNPTILVKQAQQIGELCTTEYYGEVFSDLQSVYDTLAVTCEKTGLEPNSRDFPYFKNYYYAYHNLHEKQDEYQQTNKNIAQTKLLLDTLMRSFRQNENKYVSLRDKNRAQERIQLTRNIIDRQQNIRSRQRTSLYVAKKGYNLIKQYRNTVYIARGVIRAGFRFDSLATHDILIKQHTNDSMHITLPGAVILDATINPWLEGTKTLGFELFDSYGTPPTHAEITALKMLCIERLQKRAIEKGCITQANKQGALLFERLIALSGREGVSVRFTNKKGTTNTVVP